MWSILAEALRKIRRIFQRDAIPERLRSVTMQLRGRDLVILGMEFQPGSFADRPTNRYRTLIVRRAQLWVTFCPSLSKLLGIDDETWITYQLEWRETSMRWKKTIFKWNFENLEERHFKRVFENSNFLVYFWTWIKLDFDT